MNQHTGRLEKTGADGEEGSSQAQRCPHTHTHNQVHLSERVRGTKGELSGTSADSDSAAHEAKTAQKVHRGTKTHAHAHAYTHTHTHAHTVAQTRTEGASTSERVMRQSSTTRAQDTHAETRKHTHTHTRTSNPANTRRNRRGKTSGEDSRRGGGGGHAGGEHQEQGEGETRERRTAKEGTEDSGAQPTTPRLRRIG